MRWTTGWWTCAGGLLWATVGCSTAEKPVTAPTTTTTNAVAASKGFPPTDPARVEVIPWAPSHLHQRLGEITITPKPRSTRKDIETALRDSAAALGAHAIFVVSDPNHLLKVVQVDPLLEEQDKQYPSNAIVAVAIRY